MAGGKLVMKVLTFAVGIPVGLATKKLVEAAWTAARPAAAPRKAKDPGVRWGDAIGWAALSAVGIVVADLATRKGAEEVWRTVIGTEPPAGKDNKTTKAAKLVAKADPTPND